MYKVVQPTTKNVKAAKASRAEQSTFASCKNNYKMKKPISFFSLSPVFSIQNELPLFSINQVRCFSTVSSFKPPRLPILEKMTEEIKQEKDFSSLELDKTAVVAVQHLLPTTASLFKHILELGVKPENVFLSGKFYSTCWPVEEYLESLKIKVYRDVFPGKPTDYQPKMIEKWVGIWKEIIANLKQRDIKKVIVIDDGGYAIAQMSGIVPTRWKTALGEQTTHGLYHLPELAVPVIPTACSAAKKIFESPLIGKQILARVAHLEKRLNLSPDTVCGIIGNGAIGLALARYLLNKGYPVVAYDRNKEAFKGIYGEQYIRVENSAQVIAQSHVVFGCTGKNSLEELNLMKLVQRDTTFISCSSQNVEFFSLLQQAEAKGYSFLVDEEIPFLYHMNTVSDNGREIRIVQSGFPVNFTKVAEKEDFEEGFPASEMEITRALLYLTFIQAVRKARKLVGHGQAGNTFEPIPVDPVGQQKIVKAWLEGQPISVKSQYSEETVKKFDDINWIRENSELPPNAVSSSAQPSASSKPSPTIEELFSKRFANRSFSFFKFHSQNQPSHANEPTISMGIKENTANDESKISVSK